MDEEGHTYTSDLVAFLTEPPDVKLDMTVDNIDVKVETEQDLHKGTVNESGGDVTVDWIKVKVVTAHSEENTVNQDILRANGCEDMTVDHIEVKVENEHTIVNSFDQDLHRDIDEAGESATLNNGTLPDMDFDITLNDSEVKMEVENNTQDDTDSCTDCVNIQPGETHQLFVCGSCRFCFQTLCKLHAHIESHGLGGSYHYDHRYKIAYPKFDAVCTAVQAAGPKYDNFSHQATQTNVVYIFPRSLLSNTELEESRKMGTLTSAQKKFIEKTGNHESINILSKPDSDIGKSHCRNVKETPICVKTEKSTYEVSMEPIEVQPLVKSGDNAGDCQQLFIDNSFNKVSRQSQTPTVDKNRTIPLKHGQTKVLDKGNTLASHTGQTSFLDKRSVISTELNQKPILDTNNANTCTSNPVQKKLTLDKQSSIPSQQGQKTFLVKSQTMLQGKKIIVNGQRKVAVQVGGKTFLINSGSEPANKNKKSASDSGGKKTVQQEKKSAAGGDGKNTVLQEKKSVSDYGGKKAVQQDQNSVSDCGDKKAVQKDMKSVAVSHGKEAVQHEKKSVSDNGENKAINQNAKSVSEIFGKKVVQHGRKSVEECIGKVVQHGRKSVEECIGKKAVVQLEKMPILENGGKKAVAHQEKKRILESCDKEIEKQDKKPKIENGSKVINQHCHQPSLDSGSKQRLRASNLMASDNASLLHKKQGGNVKGRKVRQTVKDNVKDRKITQKVKGNVKDRKTRGIMKKGNSAQHQMIGGLYKIKPGFHDADCSSTSDKSVESIKTTADQFVEHRSVTIKGPNGVKELPVLLRTNIKKETPNVPTGAERMRKKKTYWRCEICRRRFDSQLTFTIHNARGCTKEAIYYTCETCGKKYYSHHAFIVHKETKHTGEDVEKFVCEICERQYKYIGCLNKHKKMTHLRKEKPRCDICNATFNNQDSMMRHKRRHKEEPRFVCEHCGKKFYERWNLKVHLRQHEGTKPYKCDKCDRTFTHNVSRKHHMKKCAAVTSQ